MRITYTVRVYSVYWSDSEIEYNSNQRPHKNKQNNYGQKNISTNITERMSLETTLNRFHPINKMVLAVFPVL